ncbi:cyclic di-GMP phosphodiesterase [Ditylenchus destructor]|nr:cyclic di-GMP phosphodiesterase [Ditylenchus destructor]
MYLHGMEGSWLSHPFWKTKFVLTDPEDLRALQASGVPFCWIDSSLGLDVDVDGAKPAAPASGSTSAQPAAVAAVAPVAAVPEAPVVVPARPRPELSTAPASMGEEIERATQVMQRSKRAVMTLFGEARLGKAIDAEQCLPLVEEVASSVVRNPSALISLARLKTKDDYTYMHSVAVCALMVSLARQMGLDEAQTRDAGLAGLLHDIGKMAMPLDVLNKPGALTDDEKGGGVGGRAGRGAAASREDGRHGLSGSSRARRSACWRAWARCATSTTRSHRTALQDRLGSGGFAGANGAVGGALRSAGVPGLREVRGHLSGGDAGEAAVGQAGGGAGAERHGVDRAARAGLLLDEVSDADPTQVLDLSSQGASDRIIGREDPATWGFQKLDELWQAPAG